MLSVEVENLGAHIVDKRLGHDANGEGEVSAEKTGPDAETLLCVGRVTHIRTRLCEVADRPSSDPISYQRDDEDGRALT
jgi:hypothetical protein